MLGPFRRLASSGVSICSQIATFMPRSTSVRRYPPIAWYGTPAIGTGSSTPLSRLVSAMSRTGAAVTASSKNIS
jgi:hypothetical protein